MNNITMQILTCEWDDVFAIYRYELETGLLVELHCDSEQERPEKQVKRILDTLGYHGNIINTSEDLHAGF
jgi:hypothetical protein